MPSKAKGGRTAILNIKLKDPRSCVPADVVLKLILPSGVMLKLARQKRARRHATGSPLEQGGSNLYFLDVLDCQSCGY